MVGEAAAVIFHGGPLAEDAIRYGGGMGLLLNTGLNITLGIADLDIALMGGHAYEFISVYRRVRIWPLREKLHYSSPPSIGFIIESINSISSGVIPNSAYNSSSVHCFEKSTIGTKVKDVLEI